MLQFLFHGLIEVCAWSDFVAKHGPAASMGFIHLCEDLFDVLVDLDIDPMLGNNNVLLWGLDLNVNGEIIVVSQFTLHAKTKKGNRPSYIKAARPEVAIPLYEDFKNQLASALGKAIQSGEFGADMKVSLTNDGPVTIWLDSKNKE